MGQGVADKLIYQDLDDLIQSVREANPEIEEFDTSCFSGEYVTDGVDKKYLEALSSMRLKTNL